MSGGVALKAVNSSWTSHAALRAIGVSAQHAERNGDQAIKVTNAESVFRFDLLADLKALLNEGLG